MLVLIISGRAGAARLGSGQMAYDLPLRCKTERHATEKQRIGQAAAALVTPGSVK